MKFSFPTLLLASWFLCYFNLSFGQDYAWSVTNQGNAANTGNHLACDASGNVYFLGTLRGTVDVDPGPAVLNFSSPLDNDIIVTKFSPSGNLIWARQFPGDQHISGTSICIDQDQNILITGSFYGTMDADPGPDTLLLTKPYFDPNAFIIKLTPNGDLIWVRQIHSEYSNLGFDLAVDSVGSVFLGGAFFGDVDFDPGPGVINLTTGGYQNAFVLKLDSAGSFVWVKQFSSNSTVFTNALDLDNSGNILCVGKYSGATDFDPGPGQNIQGFSGGTADIYITKLDPNGNLVWVRTINANNSEFVKDVAIDSYSNVVITGSYRVDTDFDPGPGTTILPATGTQNGFVLKLDNDGLFQWVAPLLDPGTSTGNKLAIDQNNSIYNTGFFTGPVDFDPGPDSLILTTVGDFDAYLQILSENGDLEWVGQIGSPERDEGNSIALSPSGDIFFTGGAGVEADLDPGPDSVFHTSSTTHYGFLIKLGESCAPINTFQTVNSCDSLLSPDGTLYWKTNGIYTDTLVSSLGCDSIITIDLTIDSLDTSVINTAPTFAATASGVNYQWLDCTNGYAAIIGETDSVFTATGSGSYALEVERNGCRDTSFCYTALITALHRSLNDQELHVFPNPTHGNLKIVSDHGSIRSIRLLNCLGQLVLDKEVDNVDEVDLDLSGIPAGMYLVSIGHSKGTTTRRVVVED